MPSAWPSTGMRVLCWMWLTSLLPPLGMACTCVPQHPKQQGFVRMLHAGAEVLLHCWQRRHRQQDKPGQLHGCKHHE